MKPGKTYPLTTEYRLLFHLLKPDNRSVTCLQPNENINWKWFYHIVQLHHLVIPVYSKLQQCHPGIPAETLKMFRENLEKSKFRLLLLHNQLKDIYTLFREQQIECILFKGFSLMNPEHGEIGHRHFNDLDLYIPFDQLQNAKKVLFALDYRQIKPQLHKSRWYYYIYHQIRKDYYFQHDKNHTLVELHYSLLPMVSSSKNQLFLDNTSQSKIGNTHYQTLSASNNLLYLMIHGAYHRWCRIFWLNDIALILKKEKGINWMEISRKAKNIGFYRTLVVALMLCDILFDIPANKKIQRYYEESPVCRFLVSQSIKAMSANDDSNPIKNRFYKLGYILLINNTWMFKIKYLGGVISRKLMGINK